MERWGGEEGNTFNINLPRAPGQPGDPGHHVPLLRLTLVFQETCSWLPGRRLGWGGGRVVIGNKIET